MSAPVPALAPARLGAFFSPSVSLTHRGTILGWAAKVCGNSEPAYAWPHLLCLSLIPGTLDSGGKEVGLTRSGRIGFEY